jgi:hypothetical protein
MSSLFTQEIENQDAETIKANMPAMYDEIQKRVQAGEKLETILNWLAKPNPALPPRYREFCINAARSLHRRHADIEAAKKALENINKDKTS